MVCLRLGCPRCAPPTFAPCAGALTTEVRPRDAALQATPLASTPLAHSSRSLLLRIRLWRRARPHLRQEQSWRSERGVKPRPAIASQYSAPLGSSRLPSAPLGSSLFKHLSRLVVDSLPLTLHHLLAAALFTAALLTAALLTLAVATSRRSIRARQRAPPAPCLCPSACVLNTPT